MGPSTMVLVFENFGTPSLTTPGTSVIPGASNVEGTFTSIATGAQIAQDIYGILLWITGGNVSANDKSTLLDLGVDSAGGTAYQALLNNICCGSSGFSGDGGYWFWFPLFIKAGSQVAVRAQTSNATAGTIRVAAQFWGRPSNVEEQKVGRYSETIGAITNSGGVAFTCGTSGVDGAWTSLGTTVRNLWWWQLCVQISNSVITNVQYQLDLAYGDASNVHFIIRKAQLICPGTVEKVSVPLQMTGFCDVPAGANLWVRGTCSSTPVTGFNATAVAIGG